MNKELVTISDKLQKYRVIYLRHDGARAKMTVLAESIEQAIEVAYSAEDADEDVYSVEKL